VINLLQSVWTATYNPAPRPTPVLAPVVTGSHSKKTCINFNIVLNYGYQVNQGPDVKILAGIDARCVLLSFLWVKVSQWFRVIHEEALTAK
jgi:hypothetical protein